MRDRERERQRHGQREKQAPCEEPDLGLDLRTLGSPPEPKADAQPLSSPGVPPPIFIIGNRRYQLSLSPFCLIISLTKPHVC